MSDYLFPVRMSRRDLLAAGLASTVGLGVARAQQPPASAPVAIGQGRWRYELDPQWGRLPEGMRYGFGCGIVVDSRDRVYVTSRSANPCVAIFSRDGELIETWGREFGQRVGYESTNQVAATAHGIYWSREGDQEYLYFTENVSGSGQGRIGARVYKTDLQGRVLFTLGNVQRETDTARRFDFTNPTDVAVAPNGDIYVVDGYGSQRLSRFDRQFQPVRTIGGRGREHGQFSTCHGVWISTLRNEPEVYVADRGNGRYEVFGLDLEYKRTVSGTFVRNPCCFYQHQGHLYIPDLGSLVSIIDAEDRAVAQLGDGRGVAAAEIQASHPDKFATPHALTVDSQGSLYVLEWVPTGRVRKFRRVPQS